MPKPTTVYRLQREDMEFYHPHEAIPERDIIVLGYFHSENADDRYFLMKYIGVLNTKDKYQIWGAYDSFRKIWFSSLVPFMWCHLPMPVLLIPSDNTDETLEKYHSAVLEDVEDNA